MAKLKKRRAGISSGNITEVMDAAQAAAESGADQKYIDNPYNKDLDESINKAVNEAKYNKRKVEAADYADSKRDNPMKNLDRDTQEYARKYKDATLEPALKPEEPQVKNIKPEQESNPNLLPVIVLPPPPGSNQKSQKVNYEKQTSDNDWKEKLKNKASVIREKYDNYQESKKPKTTSDTNQNEFEKLLNISDSQADFYASKCGHTKSIKTLRMEYQILKASIESTNRERESLATDKNMKRSRLMDLQKQLDALVIERGAVYDETPTDELAKSERKATLTTLTNKISNLRSEISQIESAISHTGSEYRFSQKEAKIAGQWEKLKEDYSAYYMAVNCGQEKDKREHGWRNEWAKPIGENTLDLIGAPTINDPSTIVSYGGMTGKSAVGGINAITGGYRVNDTANSWTRTNVGDRQLVESLVNVRPNKMITPFGVPGTVGESNLQNQFQYSSPLRRIGVGDVTARGGYQLRLEDIHRRKKKSQPKIVRKKVIEKKKVMGNNKALRDAMSMVNNQKIVDIKVPTVGIKNIKGSGGEPPMKGVIVLNSMKDMTLGKTSISAGMKGINNIMANAIEITTKRAKGKKVKY